MMTDITDASDNPDGDQTKADLDFWSRQCLRQSGRQGPLILMYHSIEPGGGTPEWLYAASFDRFKAQMALLRAEGWTTLRLCDLATETGFPDRSIVVTFDDGYADNLAAFDLLAEWDMRASLFVVSRDVGGSSQWTDPDSPSRLMLSAAQLRALDEAGLEIGAHSRSHCRLAEIESARLSEEVAGSKAELESILGHEIESFCYPYGSHNDHAVASVKEAGYLAACTTRPGWAFYDRDPLRLRRIAVYSHDDLSTFARKLMSTDNDPGFKGFARHVVRRTQAFTGIDLGV